MKWTKTNNFLLKKFYTGHSYKYGKIHPHNPDKPKIVMQAPINIIIM